MLIIKDGCLHPTHAPATEVFWRDCTAKRIYANVCIAFENILEKTMTESIEQKSTGDEKTRSLSIKKQMLVNPGQGTITEQTEKLMREEQRTPLYVLVATVDDEEVEGGMYRYATKKRRPDFPSRL